MKNLVDLWKENYKIFKKNKHLYPEWVVRETELAIKETIKQLKESRKNGRNNRNN